ncbi:arabinan endo-1,5-alpha-L-arabinosidase [Crateriforma spongiae]|uniref:arabinan endo-1,5-alpha-L-arabinosidase n=1 Tax=Crateriforma spongiae TaxID=2724528 RepID=UPI001F291F7D|nr:arabinan endo-1,5-alpha-L-arabinosidase [Crateriforma spongiae]
MCRAAVLSLVLISFGFPWSRSVVSFGAETVLSGGADPTIVFATNAKSEKGYYVVSTGRGINLSYSRDLKSWTRLGRIFQQDVPAWAKKEVPKSKAIWAPDLTFHDGQYYLYYCVSSFGSQRSVIGLATNRSIDPSDPEYHWVDHGKVIESHPGRGHYNAIDPALVVDQKGRWFLFFGSFWSGLKAVAIDPETGKPPANAEMVPIAARPRHRAHAIEAPFVIFRDGYYYLFASWGRCCDGAKSNYQVVVGRSTNPLGPYVDVDGRPMSDGGGTIILSSSQRYRGPGHNSVLTTDDGQWMVHHTYDMQHLDAHRILQIRPMNWTADGWPKVGQPLTGSFE